MLPVPAVSAALPPPPTPPRSMALDLSQGVPSYEEAIEADEPPPTYLEAISLEVFDD
jgi:hypothetical protein